MASKVKTAGVERVHAPTYFRKAVQFCEAAAEAYAHERYDAALSSRSMQELVVPTQFLSALEPEGRLILTNAQPISSKRSARTRVNSPNPPNISDSC